jgi:hypothetical protein
MIDPAALAAFMQAKQVKDDCPYCGNKNWTLAIHPDASVQWGIGGFVPENKQSEAARLFVSVVVAICTNCAGLRLHALKHVQTWIDNNYQGQPPADAS